MAINSYCGHGKLVADPKYCDEKRSKIFNALWIKRNYKNSEGTYDYDKIPFLVTGHTARYLFEFGRKNNEVYIKGRLTTETNGYYIAVEELDL